MKAKKIIIPVIALCAMLYSCAMPYQSHPERETGNDACLLDSMKMLWNRLNRAGLYDSLINITHPYLNECIDRKDTLGFLYSAVFTAQAYLFMENTDSVQYYLALTLPYECLVTDCRLKTISHSVKGSYSLKAELDYTAAIEHYRKALEYAILDRNISNRIILLVNISNIYYIRSDPRGIKYARQAYELSVQYETDDYYRVLGAVTYGQMLCLNGKYRESMSLIEEAERSTDHANVLSLYPVLFLTKAETAQAMRLHAIAEESYANAFKHSIHTDFGTSALICLRYGEFCEQAAEYGKAQKAWIDGIDISYRHGNMEFRGELLRRLTELLNRTGDRYMFQKYLNLYIDYTNDISEIRKEREFTYSMLQYEQFRHAKEMSDKEVALMKAKRKNEAAVFIAVIVAVLAGTMWTLLNKYRKLYRVLVAQHRNRQQEDHKIPSQAEESGKELFMRLEKLMKEDKVFRHKDISRDKAAEMLGTNRNYLSKSVNRFAGMSFPNYVNMYRIEEAARMLAISENRPALKQIADHVGYSSVSVFTKAFQKGMGCTPNGYRKKLDKTSGIDF